MDSVYEHVSLERSLSERRRDSPQHLNKGKPGEFKWCGQDDADTAKHAGWVSEYRGHIADDAGYAAPTRDDRDGEAEAAQGAVVRDGAHNIHNLFDTQPFVVLGVEGVKAGGAGADLSYSII